MRASGCPPDRALDVLRPGLFERRASLPAAFLTSYGRRRCRSYPRQFSPSFPPESRVSGGRRVLSRRDGENARRRATTHRVPHGYVAGDEACGWRDSQMSGRRSRSLASGSPTDRSEYVATIRASRTSHTYISRSISVFFHIPPAAVRMRALLILRMHTVRQTFETRLRA